MVDRFCFRQRLVARWRSAVVRDSYRFARQSFSDGGGRAVVCGWPIVCGRDRFRFRLRMSRKRRGLNQNLCQRLRWQRRSPEYCPCPEQS